jgi:hypothetical protein
VGTFLYPAGNTKSITDTKQVNLMATWFKNGNYTLRIVAFDFAGFSNKKEIPITLNKWSTTPTPSTGTIGTGW